MSRKQSTPRIKNTLIDFKSGLLYEESTLKEEAEKLGTSVTYIKKVIRWMEEDDPKLPDTVLVNNIKNRVLKVISRSLRYSKEVA